MRSRPGRRWNDPPAGPRGIRPCELDLDGVGAPVVVPRDSILGRATGPQNVAVITGEHAGDIVISGVGAGGNPTAVAVISDLVAIARDRAAVVPAPVLTSQFTPPRSSRQRTRGLVDGFSISILAEAV